MSETKNKSEKMSVEKTVIANTVPAMLGSIMVLIYNMADLYFIGQTGDHLQVAAVSLSTPLFLIFMSLGNVFGIGGASLLSRNLGRGDSSSVQKISSFCFWSCVVIGIFMSAIVLFFTDVIVSVLGASGDTENMVSNYLRILAISGPFILISSCFTALIRAEGKPKQAMVGMMIGNLVNIVLDPIFILMLELGIEGAAIATVIGNSSGCAFYLWYLLRGDTTLSAKPQDFSMEQGIVKNILLIGVPASMASILMSVSQMVLNSNMASYGDLALAGAGVASKVIMITGILCIGLGMGVQPIFGFEIGANNKKRYDALFKFAFLFALGVSATLTLLCFLFLEQMVGAFLTDPEAFDYAYTFSKVYLSTSVFIGMLYVMINAMQAAGAAVGSLIVNVSRQGIVYIPSVYLLGHFFGLDGLVYAQPIADFSAFVLAILCYRVTYQKLWIKSKE